MSLDQLKGVEVTIKQDEGITHAISRVAKEKNIEITKSELMQLAAQVSSQFSGRELKDYTVEDKQYRAVSLVHAGEKFKIGGIAVAPAVKATPAAAAPAVAAPAASAKSTTPAVKATPAAAAKPAGTPDTFPTGTHSRHGLTIVVPTTEPTAVTGEYKEWRTLDKNNQVHWIRVSKNGVLEQSILKDSKRISGIVLYPKGDSFAGTFKSGSEKNEGIYTDANGNIFKGNFDAEGKPYNGPIFNKDGKQISAYKDGKELVTPAVTPRPAATPAAAAKSTQSVAPTAPATAGTPSSTVGVID